VLRCRSGGKSLESERRGGSLGVALKFRDVERVIVSNRFLCSLHEVSQVRPTAADNSLGDVTPFVFSCQRLPNELTIRPFIF
jgi:hypothetical protein